MLLTFHVCLWLIIQHLQHQRAAVLCNLTVTVQISSQPALQSSVKSSCSANKPCVKLLGLKTSVDRYLFQPIQTRCSDTPFNVDTQLHVPVVWSVSSAQMKKSTDVIYLYYSSVCGNRLCSTRRRVEKNSAVPIKWRGTQITATHKLPKGTSLSSSLKGRDIQLSTLQ